MFLSPQAVNERNLQLLSEKDAHVTKNEAAICENVGEIKQLREAVTRWVHQPGFNVSNAEQELTAFTPFSAEDAHFAVQKLCEELKQKLSSTEAEKENQHLTMSAEIDDLNRTKTNLEERLIELIR